MIALLSLFTVVGIVTSVALAVLYVGQLKVVSAVQSECQAQVAQKEQEANARLARYKKIVDVEKHVATMKEKTQQWKRHINSQQKEWERVCWSLGVRIATGRLVVLRW